MMFGVTGRNNEQLVRPRNEENAPAFVNYQRTIRSGE